MELALDYRRDAWLLYGNVALAETKGRDINSAQGLFEPDELGYIATHDIHTDYDQLATVSAGAAYRLKGCTGHADLLFGSGFYGGFANSDKLRSHYAVNVGAAYTLPTWRRVTATLCFDVINLLDQSYLLHDAGIGATVNQFGERRGFSAASAVFSRWGCYHALHQADDPPANRGRANRAVWWQFCPLPNPLASSLIHLARGLRLGHFRPRRERRASPGSDLLRA